MRYAFATVMIILFAVPCFGQIAGNSRIQIDFTKPSDYTGKATWTPADRLKIDAKGLGWDGTSSEPIAGSVRTLTQGTGLSWRPAQFLTVAVSIGTAGQLEGKVEARYSADAVHWTDWQALTAPQSPTPTTVLNFTGKLGPPKLDDRDLYERRLQQYSWLNVPWRSDEEAAAKWMAEKDPDFFKDHIPFVGYVQFRFSADFHSGQRITSLNADMRFVVAGPAAEPKDPAEMQNRNGPWRFKAPATAPSTRSTAATKP